MSIKKILSFDVGIKNLAYCLIEKNENNFSIHKWGIINLVDDRQKCMYTLRGGKICDKEAKFRIQHKEKFNIFDKEENMFCTCTAHKDKSTPTIEQATHTIKITTKKSKKNKETDVCEEEKSKCILCDKDAEYELSTNKNYAWCETHYQKNGKAFEKKITSKKITITNCNKQPIQFLTEKLFEKLDKESSFLSVDDILIENQPALRNPTMKTISSILYSYFVIRGITDKQNTNSNISLVKFVSPSNKLKIDKEQTDEIIDKESIIKNKKKASVKEQKTIYNLTKNLGIKYCAALIDEKDRKILDSYKKKDDMCDSFLQGFQYLFSPVPEIYTLRLKKVDEIKKEKEGKEEKVKVDKRVASAPLKAKL
jgi:hypothetical protein